MFCSFQSASLAVLFNLFLYSFQWYYEWNCFLDFISDCSLLECRNTIDFFYLISLISCNLTKLISSNTSLWIPSYFLRIGSCHLRIKTALPLPFQPGFFSFTGILYVEKQIPAYVFYPFSHKWQHTLLFVLNNLSWKPVHFST